MKVVGQATFYAYFNYFSYPKRIHGVVVKGSPDRDILIDCKTLQNRRIVSNYFPEPPNSARRVTEMSNVLSSTSLVTIKEGRGSQRTDMKFVAHSEEDLETKRQMDNLKTDLMKEYKDIFKKTLTPSDRIKITTNQSRR